MIKIRDGNLPEGKGTFLWLLPRLFEKFRGIDNLITQLVDDGYQWVTIKAQHGYMLGAGYGTNQTDLLDQFCPAAEAAGIEVHGWGYNFGNTNTWRKRTNQQKKEVDRIVEAMVRWRFRSWMLNAESEFKNMKSGANTAAVQFVDLVRETLAEHPEEIDVPIGLSTYRFVSSHPAFPFAGFLQGCDFSSPQVYWQKSRFSVEQLEKSVAQWSAVKELPIVAAGTIYPEGTWRPTGEQVRAFNERAKEMPEVIGTCYWEHYYPFKYGYTDVLDALADFVWESDDKPSPEPPPDDQHNHDKAIALIKEARDKLVEAENLLLK